MNESNVLTGLSSIVNSEKINMKIDLDAVESDLKKLELNELDCSSSEDEFEYEVPNTQEPQNDFSDSNTEQIENTNQPQVNLQNTQKNYSPYHSKIRDDNYYKNLTPPDMPEIQIGGNENPPAMYNNKPAMPNSQNYTRPAAQDQAGRFAGFSTNNSVLNSGFYTGDAEEKEEEKEKMIADIDELREELEADDINLSNVPHVDLNSSYHEVVRAYNTLRRKYNRSRCEDMGNGIIMAGARMLEMFFDGKRRYFGFNPDMTGWHRTVRAKMRRMGYERSVIVSGVMDQYKIGPIQRMLLEFVPSAFLYSMTRREQHGQRNYNPDLSNGDRSQALDDLREFD